MNIADISSLIPQSGDDGSKGLLPLVIELQAKLSTIEGRYFVMVILIYILATDELKKQPALPADVMDNINSMQSTVEQLLADMSLVS